MKSTPVGVLLACMVLTLGCAPGQAQTRLSVPVPATDRMPAEIAKELFVAADVTVRGNTFWAPADMVQVALDPAADKKSTRIDRNTFIANGKFDLDAWRKTTGFDAHSKLAAGKDGRPTGLHVISRANRYEPTRILLAVYNWDHRDAVDIDASGLAKPGSRYRIVSVMDYFGKPVAEGRLTGRTIHLPMKGHRYEPEFGAYVLTVDRPAAKP